MVRFPLKRLGVNKKRNLKQVPLPEKSFYISNNIFDKKFIRNKKEYN